MSERMRRVNESVRQVLAEAVPELKDPRIGLDAAHGVLQSRLARQLRLKRTPQLTFEYDQSVERGVRMSQLIDELAPEDDADVD
jgi:ribosome-binding factor A